MIENYSIYQSSTPAAASEDFTPPQQQEEPAKKKGKKEPAEPKEKKEKGPSASTICVECAVQEVLEFWQAVDSGEKKAFATVKVGDHVENWSLRSQNFKTWLHTLFYKKIGGVPSSNAVEEATRTLEGVALQEGTVYKIQPRISYTPKGGLLVDLCNEKWQAVAITSKGWALISSQSIYDCGVRFVRTGGQTALPTPELADPDIFNSFFDLVGIPNDDSNTRMLIMGYLVGAFNPVGPYPVLAVQGMQGSGKSTLCRFIKALIDPSVLPVRAIPRDEDELAVQCKGSRLLAFDNLSASELADWFSDAICRVSTGAGVAKRKLYTDDGEVLLPTCLPVVFNGIDDLARRGDLLDRTIVVDIPAIEKSRRRTERKVYADFDKLSPALLGALFTAVSSAVKRQDEIDLKELPRMADFCVWVEAASEAFDWVEGAFAKALIQNQKEAKSVLLESSPLGAAILAALPENIYVCLFNKKTAAELLNTFKTYKPEGVDKKFWPQTPNSLGQQLRRLAPSLQEQGINVIFGRDTGKDRKRWITIERVQHLSEPSDEHVPCASE